MDFPSIASVIGSALALIGVLALGLWQNKIWKSQAKKSDVESYTILIDSLTKRTDAEFTIMKTLNAQQLVYITDLRQQILILTQEKKDLQEEIRRLEKRLSECELKLNKGAN